MKNEASMLTANEKDKLAKLLLKYESIISRGPTDIGNCTLLTHRIDTGDTIPIRQAPQQIPTFNNTKFNKILVQKKLRVLSNGRHLCGRFR